jgi:Fe-S oxidoreductase
MVFKSFTGTVFCLRQARFPRKENTAVYELRYRKEICDNCKTIDCLVKCPYLNLDWAKAKEEKQKLIAGEDSPILTQCVTCYACEEYCPNNNHPFYLIVDRQEERGIVPVPGPATRQQLYIMRPQRTTTPSTVRLPLINLCAFSMLEGCIRGSLFENASVISGTDIFCNIMWLHFGKNSVIRERLPLAIDAIVNQYLKDTGVDEIVHFHDECHGAYTHLAPAFGISVPFKSVHLFEFLNQRLDTLKNRIKPIGQKVAYQRPCSNRLIPETDVFVDEIFRKIGVTRVKRRYDRENALCCTYAQQAQQRDILADEVLTDNIDDMVAAEASFCVFNCPACFFTMSEAVSERGIMPILMSDLCLMALGE